MATKVAPRQPGVPTAEEQAKTGEGGGGSDPETQLTIMTNKETRWYFDASNGKWYAEYGLPNSERVMIFEADPDQMDALFGAGMRPSSYGKSTFKNLTSRTRATFGGNIAEIEGKGAFEDHVQRVINVAMDEGHLPEWAGKSGAALDILFTAQSEGKSTEWMLEHMSALPEFKTRFPGLSHLVKTSNMSLADGIKGFLEFEAGTIQAMKAGGFNTTIVTPDLVGALLNKGHSLTVINDTVTGFQRMTKFRPATKAFNQVLAAKGLAPISSLQDMFDFVKGRAPADVYDIYEASSIQEAAVAAGLGKVFSSTDAVKAAAGSQHTLETATEAMQKAAELLLRLRNEVNVGSFGLDHEELIDLNLGLSPSSGRTQAEIMDSVNRAVMSAQKSMQGRSQPFKSFTDTGTPQSASQRSLRQGE